MKSLKESILSSTKSGKEGVREKIEKWLQDNKADGYTIQDDNTVILGRLRLTEPIPEYIKIESVKKIEILSIDALENLPDVIDHLRIACGGVIKDFSFLENRKCGKLVISDCDIHSLKGLPKDIEQIIIGDNKQHFKKKDIKKLVNAKPNNIYTLGYLNETGYNSLTLGENDVEYIKEEGEKLKKILFKEIPELKSVSISARKDGFFVWIRLDFLLEKDHPHGISDNSIYLDFKYTLSDSSIEKSQEGHLDLTKSDKEGKYKYYALKGFSAPYLDNGGKKFRKTRLDDFNAKEIADKIIDWVKDVVDAALEDQGGELNRK